MEKYIGYTIRDLHVIKNVNQHHNAEFGDVRFFLAYFISRGTIRT